MSSSINAAYPQQGNASTSNVRSNFAAAASEIEALQDGGTRVIDATGPSYGADNTGATNALSAIQAALDAGSTVYLPVGTYLIEGQLTMGDNQTLTGAGFGTLLNFNYTQDIGITNDDHVGGNSGITICNMKIDGFDLTNDPIELNNATDCFIKNVWVTQGNHDGIELQSCSRCIISNCIADNSVTYNGFELDGCDYCIIEGCIAHMTSNAGIELDGASTYNVISGCFITTCPNGVKCNSLTDNNYVVGVVCQNISGNDYIDSSGTNIGIIPNSGASANLGINVEEAQHKLHIHSPAASSNCLAHFTNTTTGALSTDGMSIGYNGATSVGLLMVRENQALSVGTNDTERMRIEAGGNITFNEDGADVDFRVEGSGQASTLFVDGGNDRVGIGTALPFASLHIHDSGTESGDHAFCHFTTGDSGSSLNDGLTVGYSGAETATVTARDGTGLQLQTAFAGPVTIGTDSTVRMTIASDGGVVLHNLPTADPVVAGELWNDSGTVKISAG